MIARLITYSDIFDDEVTDSSSLIENIPSYFILSIFSFINASLYYSNSLKKETFLFKKLIEQLAENDRNKIYNRFTILIKQHGLKLQVFPLYSILILIEKEVLNNRVIDGYTTPSAEDELNILKYILLNNNEIDRQHGQIKGNNLNELMWSAALPQLEFNFTKSFISNLLIAKDLFKYFQDTYETELNQYITQNNATSVKDFLKKIADLYFNGYNKNEHYFNSRITSDLIAANPILTRFCLEFESFDVEEYKSKHKNKYFKGLRETPILKHENGHFNIINWNFIVDKFYKGLLFDFFHFTNLKKTQNLSFEDYKSRIGENFSEKQFFKEILTKIYVDHDVVLLSDEDSEDYNFDFYIRIDNKIIIIEFKDYLMPDTIKNDSYDKIKSYIDSKFIKTRRNNKAIIQLKNQIVGINENPNLYEEHLEDIKERLFIYPVTVYTDLSFSVPGINNYLNDEFFKIMNQHKTDFFIIRSFTMISLDLFLENFDYLKNNRTSLVDLIEGYYHVRKLNKGLCLEHQLQSKLLKNRSLENTLISEIKEYFFGEQIEVENQTMTQ